MSWIGPTVGASCLGESGLESTRSIHRGWGRVWRICRHEIIFTPGWSPCPFPCHFGSLDWFWDRDKSSQCSILFCPVGKTRTVAKSVNLLECSMASGDGSA